MDDIINQVLQDYGIDTPEGTTTVVTNTGVTTNVTVEEFNGDMQSVENALLGTQQLEHFDEVVEVTDETPATTQEDSDFEALNALVREMSKKDEDIKDEDYIDYISEEYMIDSSTSRFSGAEWYNAIQEKTIVLGGAGGIGSMALFCLSRVKPRQIFIYDDDTVETGNMSGQLYSKDMIGLKKVNAMVKLAEAFSDYHAIFAIDQRFTVDTNPAEIMICGFDNMRARKDFFKVWKTFVASKTTREDKRKCLFIDGRLAMEDMQVFCITGDDAYNMNRYEKEFLFNDSEVEDAVCSMKQTSHCANMIGSLICNLFVNFVANSLRPNIPRQLPFKTFYDAKLMYFKTES